MGFRAVADGVRVAEWRVAEWQRGRVAMLKAVRWYCRMVGGLSDLARLHGDGKTVTIMRVEGDVTVYGTLVRLYRDNTLCATPLLTRPHHTHAMVGCSHVIVSNAERMSGEYRMGVGSERFDGWP